MQNLGIELAGGTHGHAQSMRRRLFESPFDFGQWRREVGGYRDQRLVCGHSQGNESEQPPESRTPIPR